MYWLCHKNVVSGPIGSPATPGRLLRRFCLAGVCACLLLLTGCVVNPVTGTRELGFVSTERQIAVGEQQYLPAQQMQGGQYGVHPEVTAYVQRVGQRLAAVSDIALPYEFVVLNSSVPNAWALPGGKLAINRGLLTELRNEAELAAVLGHEIVHAAARHGAKAMERGMVTQVLMVGVAIGGGGGDYANAALGAAQTAAGLLNQKYGRDAERESDYYGTRYMAEAGYDPYAAVTLQETFVRLSEGRDADWVEGLFSSHPPSEERVANNRRLVAELREEGYIGGDFGADAYQNAMRQLRADTDAYKASDEAGRALREGKLDEAQALIQNALNQQPAEPTFHGLRGDLRLEQKRYEDAVINYDRAIERDPQYFVYYLGRGVARARLDQHAEAKADLGHSVELLPTAVAYQELGAIAEVEGDIDEAVRYYQIASQGGGAAGQAALVKAVRLDLPRNPDRYVETRLGQDASGRLILQIYNPTPVSLIDLRVRVDVRTVQGDTLRYDRKLTRLEPGQRQQLLVAEDAAGFSDASAAVVEAHSDTKAES